MVKSISSRKVLWNVLLAGVLGAVIGFGIFWIPMLAKYGLELTAAANSVNIHNLETINTLGAGGSLIYTWSDFIFAKTVSKMDNPIGVGVFLFWLAFFSILVVLYFWGRKPRSIFSPDRSWKLISLIWVALAFIGVHGNRMPFPMLMPHRWWSILAIGIALISVEGFFVLGKLSRRFRIPSFFVYTILIIGIIITSGHPKYVVETSYWPPGVIWGSMDELNGYINYVKPLPYNTKVFTLCSNDLKILAFDKFTEPWDPSHYEFKKTAFDVSTERLNLWLNSRGYEYLVLDSYCLRDHDVNATNRKLAEIGNSTYFSLYNGNQGFFMFKVL